MRLFLATTLTMTAFAANSLLNRLALAEGEAGPASFAALRIAAGAVVLTLLVMRSSNLKTAIVFSPRRLAGAGALSIYMLGFSFAYISLDAGVGALILFGFVQITMFAGALKLGETVLPQRWVGAGLSFAGLLYLMWPNGAAALNMSGSALMALGAVGWGVYSLIGRGVADPLSETAGNFIWAIPAGAIALVVWPDGITLWGAILAIVGGAVTSGLGYALWYWVLREIDASLAAIAQLTVPIIAALGGTILLGEILTWRFLVAAFLVLGGILLALHRPNVSGKRI